MTLALEINGPVGAGDLFVFYGLLKQGAAGMPDHIDLDAGGEFLRDVSLRGDLYDLGGYPGIIDGDGLVKGILYRLDNAALAVPLDEFEDVVPGENDASLYLRVKREVCDHNGQRTGETAWVYWYNQPIDGYQKIVNGNWPLDAGNRQKERRHP